MSLSGDLDKFLTHMTTEHGQWHRTSLISNNGVVTTDIIFPSMSLLFQLLYEAIQVMFRLADMLVKDSKRGEHSVSNKATEKFKANTC